MNAPPVNLDSHFFAKQKTRTASATPYKADTFVLTVLSATGLRSVSDYPSLKKCICTRRIVGRYPRSICQIPLSISATVEASPSYCSAAPRCKYNTGSGGEQACRRILSTNRETPTTTKTNTQKKDSTMYSSNVSDPDIEKNRLRVFVLSSVDVHGFSFPYNTVAVVHVSKNVHFRFQLLDSVRETPAAPVRVAGT